MPDLLTRAERDALTRHGMPMVDRSDPYPNPLLRALDTIEALVAMLRELAGAATAPR